MKKRIIYRLDTKGSNLVKKVNLGERFDFNRGLKKLFNYKTD